MKRKTRRSKTKTAAWANQTGPQTSSLIFDTVSIPSPSYSFFLWRTFLNPECVLVTLIRPTLSRKVPPCKPGPAQGFFLLKGSFFLPLCLPGGSGSGFLTEAPTDNFIGKGALQINKLNWTERSAAISSVLPPAHCWGNQQGGEVTTFLGPLVTQETVPSKCCEDSPFLCVPFTIDVSRAYF